MEPNECMVILDCMNNRMHGMECTSVGHQYLLDGLVHKGRSSMALPSLLEDEVPPDEGLADRASDHKLMHVSLSRRNGITRLAQPESLKKCDQTQDLLNWKFFFFF